MRSTAAKSCRLSVPEVSTNAASSKQPQPSCRSCSGSKDECIASFSKPIAWSMSASVTCGQSHMFLHRQQALPAYASTNDSKWACMAGCILLVIMSLCSHDVNLVTMSYVGSHRERGYQTDDVAGAGSDGDQTQVPSSLADRRRRLQ